MGWIHHQGKGLSYVKCFKYVGIFSEEIWLNLNLYNNSSIPKWSRVLTSFNGYDVFKLLIFFSPQKTVNSEKSFEALLSHVISELSKNKSVYKVNSEESTMVRC